MDRLEPLLDESFGEELPLGPALLAFHGPLRMPRRADRPHVFANFVETLDGITAVNPPHGCGGDVSGHFAPDRALMGLLRAVADAVVIGAGTLRAEPRHVWTAERVFPELAPEYQRLRAELAKPPSPVHVVITSRGEVDLSLPVFSGRVSTVLVTTAAGEERLRAQGRPVRIAVPAPGPSVSLGGALEAVGLGPGALVLVEAGPHLLGHFLAEGAVDELFLTVAPRIVGRAAGVSALGLVEGRCFGSGAPFSRLLSVKHCRSFLFLRYALPTPDAALFAHPRAESIVTTSTRPPTP